MLQASKLGPDVVTKLPKPSRTRARGVCFYPRPPTQHGGWGGCTTEQEDIGLAACTRDHVQGDRRGVRGRARSALGAVTARADGRGGGAVVYLLDDAMWPVEDGSATGSVPAVTFEEMALLGARR